MTAFVGFQQSKVRVQDGIEIYFRQSPKRDVDAAKPPLLLLHGFPQTGHMYNKVAPALAEKFALVIPDLRGYGQSSKPAATDDHEPYSKKLMAQDMVNLMAKLGYERFSVISHDRGARVAHRLAIDHGDKVDKLMILDIAPTLWTFENVSMVFAITNWHWFFLPQPAPLVEKAIVAAPENFWDLYIKKAKDAGGLDWSQADEEEYKKYFLTQEGVHGPCEDYRAAATIDLEHDRESRSKKEQIAVPNVYVIWGRKGLIEKFNKGDVVGIWKEFCAASVSVRGESFDCGHFIPEEKPEEFIKKALEFFSD